MVQSSDKALNAADIESLEREIVELALARTGARHGAIFLWDERAGGLAIDFHIVEGLVVTLPGVVLRRGRKGEPSGIAFEALDRKEVYLCSETRDDPNYAPYFLDVRSVLAAPIAYQRRAIGVITVSSRRPHAFDDSHVAAIEELAASSGKFLRRAQLYRATRKDDQRPFLIKGISPEWLEVERRIEQVSPTEAAVLIHGESGTGKELVARAIHFNSRREGKPFVTVNCAAIPETMLESVLFGHVAGAFTSATFDKIGEFQKAHGGTLFLDEVGELPMPLQAKVLRAVELGEVQPLGSNKPAAHVDVRLLCATHRDLPRMADEGRFRADLYYRLSVMTMELPPLRTYKDNLEVLVHVFVQEAARKHGKAAPRVSPAALTTLAAHDFPGNVRELKNAVEHAVIMTQGDELQPHDLPASVVARPGPPPKKVATRKTLRDMREEWLAPLERRYLTALLGDCGGNVRRAAEEAGVNTVTMYRLLRKRGLQLRRVAE